MIFDLGGVLVDSEIAWRDARRGLVEQNGGSWLLLVLRLLSWGFRRA
jgi:beta-phosphoglucomutase-like phosphatase (HAD superfamily)